MYEFMGNELIWCSYDYCHCNTTGITDQPITQENIFNIMGNSNGSISNTFYRTFGIQYLFVNTGKRTKHEYAVQWYAG